MMIKLLLKFYFILLLTTLTVSVHNSQSHEDNLEKLKRNKTDKPETLPSPTEEECLTTAPCSMLPADCFICKFNYTCVYGEISTVNCTVSENTQCTGERTFIKEFICQYCYQSDPTLHRCVLKGNCNAVAAPRVFYRTNCTVDDGLICLGRRKFHKNVPCNWTDGYRWSTALLLSITLGGFGADRFYLGHWQEGIGKLFSFGGLGVWTLIDVILIGLRYLGPADGSLYI